MSAQFLESTIHLRGANSTPYWYIAFEARFIDSSWEGMDQHLNDFIRTSILGSNMQGKATIYLGFELCSLWFHFEEGSNDIWFDSTLTSEMEWKPSLNFCRSHNSLWVCLVQSNKSRW
jgi:hypothetical protein